MVTTMSSVAATRSSPAERTHNNRYAMAHATIARGDVMPNAHSTVTTGTHAKAAESTAGRPSRQRPSPCSCSLLMRREVVLPVRSPYSDAGASIASSAHHATQKTECRAAWL